MNQISLFIANNKHLFDPLKEKNYKYHKGSIIMRMSPEEFIHNCTSDYFHDELSEIIKNPNNFNYFLDRVQKFMKKLSSDESDDLLIDQLDKNSYRVTNLSLIYEINCIESIYQELIIRNGFNKRGFQLIIIQEILDINIELIIPNQKIKNDYIQMYKSQMRKINF